MSETGTGQGQPISPILANIYLHYILDEWFEEVVKPRMKGEAHEIRFADDAILCFEHKEDAEKVKEVLTKRFSRFGLTLHPEKTRLVELALIALSVWWRQGRLLIPVAITGVLLIPALSYVLFRKGIIVPVASWIVVQVGASLTAFLVHTHFVRRRLGEAVAGRQDYAFRLQAVAHEIKTPLTAIHASSQLMAEAAIPQRKKEEIAQRIHKEAGRLSGVVTTFLDVERIAAGVLKLQRQQVDLAKIVADASERASLLAGKKNIAIEQDLDPVTVAADPELLQFAIYNLLVNAIKYSPETSSVRVTLRARPEKALLAVSDKGCGIEHDEKEHIFERFYRARKQEASVPGSGVGLTLVKEIVTQHGGSVEVASAPGKGSTFTVSLPREVAK